jgi:predicted nucleic acid-binding protein
MSPLTGVLDASVIIGLTKGSVFDHLRSLYTTLYVPKLVSEQVIQHAAGRPGADELAQALGVWITEVIPDPVGMQPFATLRSAADRQVLAIAHDPVRAVDHLLSDDRQLLGRAMHPRLIRLRTPDLVVLMKRRGLLPEAKAVLDRMRNNGFGIDDLLYLQALQTAGE